jgi:hypothetical protein
MLKYGAPNERKTNLNFDLKSLARASGLLLGKEKTQEYLKFKSTKSLLKWLGELEKEATYILKNKTAPFPRDLESKSAMESLIAERTDLAYSVLDLQNLSTRIEASDLESLIRIRSKNQYNSINKSGVESIKNRDGATEILVRVALKDLPSFINSGESTGYGKLRIEVGEQEAEYIKTQLKKGDIQFLFRDELTQRPEPKRIAQGNKLKAILRDARSSKKTPRDIANEQSELPTGNGIILSRNAKVTDIVETTRDKGAVTLEITSLLPEVREAINKDPKGEAGRGSITDRNLKQHCSNEYGCNGRDFVQASKAITESLNNNLSDAAKLWFNKTSIGSKEIGEFLEEYYTLTVCLDNDLTSINNLDDYRTIVKNAQELTPSKNLESLSTTVEPETAYSVDAVGQQSIPTPTAASLLAGAEWLGELKQEKIDASTKSQNAKEYSAYLEKIFSIQDANRKIGLIQSNYYRIPNTNLTIETNLDEGPNTISMVAPHLSNQLIEKFEEERERQDNEIFNSKADELKDYSGMQRMVIDDKEIGVTRTVNSPAKKKEIIDKAEFIRRQKKIVLELPYRGEIIRRLTKYPYRSSGLDFDRSAAEKFDNEISLAPKPRKSTPKMPNGSPIRLEDCLSLEGLEDLRQKINQEDYIKEINYLKDTIESWQSNRPITPASKNPIDRNIHKWLMAISTGQVTEKATSLGELSQIINNIVGSGGNIPYESERGVERFATPLRSSAIPLLLLCGTGFDKLAKKKGKEIELDIEGTEMEDAAKGFDLTLRWTNAQNLNRHPLAENKEAFIEDLDKILNSDKEEKEKEKDLLEHTAAIELSEVPNFKSSYLASIGTDEGLSEIEEENNHYKDLILPLSSSPTMMTVGGEELPISEVINLLKENGFEFELTEAELEKIDLSPDIALDNWRKSLQKTVDQIDLFFTPKQKDISLDIFLTEAKELSSEEDPFVKAITELHEALPTSADDLKSIATQMLAHNPTRITLETQEGKIVLSKGSQETWSTKTQNGRDKLGQDLVNKAQELIKLKNSEELSPEDQLLLEECQKEAEKVILFENIEKLGPALSSLPNSVANKSNIKEIKEPISILSKQIEKAKVASNYGLNFLDLMEEDEEDPENPWGHRQSVLNPKGSIEYLCNKITQDSGPQFDEEGNRLPEDKSVSYFSRQLITEENKTRAIEILKTSGIKAAAAYLKDEITNNTKKIVDQAAESLPDMVRDIKSALSTMVEHTYSEMGRKAVGNSSSISRIIKDKFKGRLLEKKVNDLIPQLRSESREGTAALNKLTSQRAVRNKLALKAQGDIILTDKLWAKAWLETPKGKENLARRLNTANWVLSVKEIANAKTSVAFLEFCHHRHLPSVPEAINKGNLSDNQKAIINKSLKEFSKGLSELGVDPKKTSMKTQLLGALSLSCATKSKRHQKLWSKEIENELKTISPSSNLESKDITPKFAYIVEDAKTLPSPYLKAEMERGGLDQESDIDNGDSKTKLRTVKRAIAALYQAVPLDITKVSPKKQKTREKRETQEVPI